jgi:protein phosphatase
MHGHIRRWRAGEPSSAVIPGDDTLSTEANQVLAGILLSNRAVHQRAAKSAACRGMGATVAALLFTERTLVAANVGDSPIFLIHRGQLEQLSVPHTLMAEHGLAGAGGTLAPGVDLRHVLTRAVGVSATVEASICEVPCFAGDALVIASDGLTDMVAPEELAAIVACRTPATACRELVDLANRRGGVDNITVVVLKINKTTGSRGKVKTLLARVSDGFSFFGSKKEQQTGRGRKCRH